MIVHELEVRFYTNDDGGRWIPEEDLATLPANAQIIFCGDSQLDQDGQRATIRYIVPE